jgi:hypothetical protein
MDPLFFHFRFAGKSNELNKLLDMKYYTYAKGQCQLLDNRGVDSTDNYASLGQSCFAYPSYVLIKIQYHLTATLCDCT